VTNPSRRDERPSLGDLQDRALEEPLDAGADGARRFMGWFDREVVPSRGDAGAPGRAVHAVASFEDVVPWCRGATGRGLALGALATGIVFLVGHALSRRSQVPLPEGSRAVARGSAPFRAEVPNAPVGQLESGDPCREAVRAAGVSPLIDDFEDANELVALLEARNGYWVVIADTDRNASELVLLPSVRPRASPTNRYALHVAGERLTKWGASVQVELGPTCYDASAYRGIAFDVLGPGRLYAGVRQIDAVPVDRGGNCTADCYDSHLHPVDATSEWTHHEFEWSELHQQRKSEPANPRRLNGLEFLVRSEDTPYDLWIDNLAFMH
jgi:hypothetical protein